MSFIDYPVVVSFDELLADLIDTVAANIPGWAPREGHLDLQMLEVEARLAYETAVVAGQVPPAVFRYFGASALGIPPIDAASASVPSTWTLTDALGHTITAGTYVYFRIDGDTSIPFQVQTDVVVAPGSPGTATGEVVLVAVDAGSVPNGLPAGAVYPVDALAWVAGVTTEATTSGGVDAESDDGYMTRLREELRLLSPRPILPADFSTLAKRIAGVERSVAIDGYDADTDTYDNERTITVAVADVNGSAVSNDVKDEVEAYLQSLREINFVVYVIDPTYTDVDVTATVTAFTGQDIAEVQAACEAALTSYLSPANWDWRSTVRVNELISLLDRVAGVDYVVSVTTPASNVTLTGPASLPEPGTLSITVNAGS